ncbi:growth factor receptor domain-containing protein [Auricularia subglabra TFB-10046 SS5]|nr:growth factor receptor domain-containing protein [Auricularia subglabra TFB-10046 SS5]
MLASVAPLILLAATAGQCLSGSSNISIGAVLSTSGSDPFVLLPGTYSSTSDPQNLRNALTASSSRLSYSPGFAPDPTDSSSLIFPLTIELQPGVLSTTASLYRGQTTFTAVPTNGTIADAKISLDPGSLVVSQNAWAAVKSGDQRIVLWDSVADMSQLPSGLGSAAMALVDLQSTACSPACSGAGVCTPSGTCECPSGGGFTGDRCEECAEGFFGPKCDKCPEDCDKCDDGLTGSGKCLVPKVDNAPESCSCLNGACGANGKCECNAGWTNASNGTACAACAQGFFLTSDGNCQACQLGCTSCQSGSGTCTQCASGLTVDANDRTKCIPATSQSSKQCPDGSFLNGNSCALCSPLCKTCTGAGSDGCLVCAQGTYKFNGGCVPIDSNGVCSGSSLVANNNKNLCDACPAKCTACGIPNFNVASTLDQVQCTKCLPGSYLSDGKCIDACPAGTFISDDGFTCAACDSSCSTCVGDAKFCLTCSGNSLASGGTCTSSCPSGTFSSSGACLPCHSDCATCSGSGFNQCTSCKADRPVLQASKDGGASVGRCLATCSKSQFFDSSSNSCSACDSSCSSCSGSGSNRCLACANPNQILKGGACVDAKCTSSTSVVPGLGACLSTLVTAPFIDNTPKESPSTPSPPPSGGGRRPLEWWQILLMALGCAFIFLMFLMCWRRRMRKKRAAQTAVFARQMKQRGLLSRGAHWLGDKLFGNHHARHEARSEKNVQEMLDRMRAAEEARHHREMEVLEAHARGAGAGHGKWEWTSAPSIVTTRYEDKHRAPSPQPSLLPRYERDALSVDPHANRLSAPSLYSVMTGAPSRRPEPRQPLRDRDAVQQPVAGGSRFSSSTIGSSIWNSHPAAREPQPNYELDPIVKHHRTGDSFESYASSASSGSQNRNPFRR